MSNGVTFTGGYVDGWYGWWDADEFRPLWRPDPGLFVNVINFDDAPVEPANPTD